MVHQRRVDALEPRETAYDVRDDELKGFGVRVLPSGGKRYFVHSQRDGRRVWKIVGKDIAEEEARARANAVLTRAGPVRRDPAQATVVRPAPPPRSGRASAGKCVPKRPVPPCPGSAPPLRTSSVRVAVRRRLLEAS